MAHAEERASETERLTNAHEADAAMETERDRRVTTDKHLEADGDRERKQNARRANKMMDSERHSRLTAHGESPRKSPATPTVHSIKSVTLTPRSSDAPPPPPWQLSSTESAASACNPCSKATKSVTKTCVIA